MLALELARAMQSKSEFWFQFSGGDKVSNGDVVVYWRYILNFSCAQDTFRMSLRLGGRARADLALFVQVTPTDSSTSPTRPHRIISPQRVP